MNLNDLRKRAKEEGKAGEFADEAPPDGKYTCQIVSANTGETSNGKVFFGVLLKVLEGEYADTTFWANMYIGGGNSATADDISFRQLERIGIDDSYFEMYTSLEPATTAVVGMILDVKVSRTESKTSDRVFVNTNFIKETPKTAPAGSPPLPR